MDLSRSKVWFIEPRRLADRWWGRRGQPTQTDGSDTPDIALVYKHRRICGRVPFSEYILHFSASTTTRFDPTRPNPTLTLTPTEEDSSVGIERDSRTPSGTDNGGSCVELQGHSHRGMGCFKLFAGSRQTSYYHGFPYSHL